MLGLVGATRGLRALAPLVTLAAMVGGLLLTATSGRGEEPAQGQDAIVERTRMFLLEDGRVAEYTALIDSRAADPDAVMEALAPGGVDPDAPGASGQFVTFAQWPAQAMPVPMLYNDDFDPPGVNAIAALQWAAQTWTAAGSSFSFGGVGTTSATVGNDCDGDSSDGLNVVHFAPPSGPLSLPSNVLGRTCTFTSLSDIAFEFDMVLSSTVVWGLGDQTPLNAADLKTVISTSWDTRSGSCTASSRAPSCLHRCSLVSRSGLRRQTICSACSPSTRACRGQRRLRVRAPARRQAQRPRLPCRPRRVLPRRQRRAPRRLQARPHR